MDILSLDGVRPQVGLEVVQTFFGKSPSVLMLGGLLVVLTLPFGCSYTVYKS
ncbi:hypothetical protein L7F22_034492, partial [Adiantum nelumboides]|nr:hypothetical protein [Adiantum nelumboides]